MATQKVLKENIRKKAIELGASLVNFASAACCEEDRKYESKET